MLKVVIILDCNECGSSLKEALVRSSSFNLGWDAEVEYLKQDAERQRWGFLHDFYSVCPDCIDRQVAQDDWMQEQEEYDQRPD